MSFRISKRELANKRAKLHWFGNVYRDNQNRWRIRVAFEHKDGLMKVDCPVGLIPILRIGEWYDNGLPISTYKIGMIGSVTISVGNIVESRKAIDGCRRFNYYLHGDKELMNQIIYTWTIDGQVFYIPCLELIRALFASDKTLSNLLFKPNGLAHLLEQVDIKGRNLYMDFTREIPASSLNDSLITHLAWIVSNHAVLSSYESVGINVLNGSGNENGIPLSMSIPDLTGLRMNYRGICKGNEVLVFEIISISELPLNVDRIYYTHPNLKQRVYEPGCKKGRLIKDIPPEYSVIAGTPKEETSQPVFEHEATNVSYTNEVELIRIEDGNTTIHKGFVCVPKIGRGGIPIAAGVDESLPGRALQPIDIQSLIAQGEAILGLEEFFRMIESIKFLHPELSIDSTILELPPGRKFSILDNGERRKYAVVTIYKESTVTYILEVARPDEHSVSTLLLKSRNNDFLKHHEEIQKIVKDLIFNQGHWNTDTISIFAVKKVRHTQSTIREWAIRVYEALIS